MVDGAVPHAHLGEEVEAGMDTSIVAHALPAYPNGRDSRRTMASERATAINACVHGKRPRARLRTDRGPVGSRTVMSPVMRPSSLLAVDDVAGRLAMRAGVEAALMQEQNVLPVHSRRQTTPTPEPTSPVPPQRPGSGSGFDVFVRFFGLGLGLGSGGRLRGRLEIPPRKVVRAPSGGRRLLRAMRSRRTRGGREIRTTGLPPRVLGEASHLLHHRLLDILERHLLIRAMRVFFHRLLACYAGARRSSRLAGFSLLGHVSQRCKHQSVGGARPDRGFAPRATRPTGDRLRQPARGRDIKPQPASPLSLARSGLKSLRHRLDEKEHRRRGFAGARISLSSDRSPACTDLRPAHPAPRPASA